MTTATIGRADTAANTEGQTSLQSFSITEMINLLRQVLERPIAYHAIFARVAGSVTGGLLLSQLYYWQPRGSDPNGWIYKTETEWQEETYLSRREQQTARKQLISVGVLETERKGVPARLYYRLNLDALYRKILQFSGSPPPQKQRKTAETLTQSQLGENAQLVERKRTTSRAKTHNLLSENAQLNSPQSYTQQGVEPPLIEYTENTTHTTIHRPQPDGSRRPHPEGRSVVVEDRENKEEKLLVDSRSEEKARSQLNSHVVDKPEKELREKPIISHEDQSSERRENDSQRIYWECPNPRKRREFMAWLAQSARGIESARHAANWCNKYPDDADLAWDDFNRESDRTTSIASIFEKWMPEQHEMTARSYKNAVFQGGINVDVFMQKNGDWFQWAQNNSPQLLAEI